MREEEDRIKEHRALLLRLYEENQKFLDKAIFTISSAAIPTLLNFHDKLIINNLSIAIFLSLITCFVLSILLQLSALRKAKKSCDLLLSGEYDKGVNFKKTSDFLDSISYFIFSVAMILVVVILSINLTNKMSNKKPVIKTNSLTIPSYIADAVTIPNIIAKEMNVTRPENKSYTIPLSVISTTSSATTNSTGANTSLKNDK